METIATLKGKRVRYAALGKNYDGSFAEDPQNAYGEPLRHVLVLMDGEAEPRILDRELLAPLSNYRLEMNDLNVEEGEDDVFHFDASSDGEAIALLESEYEIGDMPYTLTENGRKVSEVWP